MPKEKKEIAAAPVAALDPQGLIGEILALEGTVAELQAQAKELQRQADEKREQIVTAMQTMKLESVRHATGYVATVAHRVSYGVADEDALIEKLKENKLTNFVRMVPAVPEHEAPAMDLIPAWLKGVGAENIKTMFGDTVQVKQTDYLQIKKPKA